MALGWIFTALPFFAGSGLSEITRLTYSGWLSVAFLGIFCSGFAYIFWYDALKHVAASRAGVLLYFEPVVAVIVAAALLQETILFATMAGGGLILLGVWVVNRRS
jgi:drug/metabolite transporter (DMT)-like permease